MTIVIASAVRTALAGRGRSVSGTVGNGVNMLSVEPFH